MSDKARKINNTIDLILMIFFLVFSLYFLIEALVGKVIPLKYILIMSVVLLAILLLLFLTFKIHHVSMTVIRKVLLIPLCGALIFGAMFQGKIRSAFSNVNDGSTSIDRMYVVVKRDSDKKLEDLQSVGYVDKVTDLITYSLTELDSYSFEETPYKDVETLLAGLNNNEVEAVLMSAQDQTYEQKLEGSTYDATYKTIHTIEMTVDNESTVVENNLTKNPFVVYVSGLDDMGKPDYNGLSDVNMLLMVDPLRHHVEMVSINRDTYVPNPKYNGAPDKLTHLGWQGADAGKETLEKIFGIQIDYTAKVTFESLIKMIDTLGGIDVDVKLSFTEQNEYRSFASNDLIHLEKGYQHLNGSQALAYARHRHTAGWDVKGREEAQRDIIAATVNKLLSVEGALKAGDVLNVAASYISTNMSMDSAKEFLMNAIDEGAGWTFGSSTINSAYEYRFPCASYGAADLYAVLLKEDDIRHVHDIYVNMHTDVKLKDFEFDLNDMEQYESDFELDKKVITVENYYRTVPTYFPSYLRHNF